ncbi:MAG: carbamate kinase [Deltaproteobacteria bacterium RIFOXYA12_FULL_58_15]|nr:MAG: carbamate kinase [Deltaproteobacteria bacterium RIFOXYA12_FULL_58_15]OGR12040.1 MAG: carbamate kinase [Deltaproteobacteria bacterium RIFOXYB12_FULL_58_9]
MALAVIAIGGNSLVQSNQVGTIAEQFENTALTCKQLAYLVREGWDLLLTHGNGPQVGNVMLRVELAADTVYTLPLDVCDADTQGGMGYMLQQVFTNELTKLGLQRTVVTFVTQVLVTPEDPAFHNPTKPIGPFFTEEVAQKKMSNHGWHMTEDSGRGWRRTVPSPIPKRILEVDAIKCCIGNGIIPIAVGGGGVPVYERDGMYFGIEAVVDKDRASALLANTVGAPLLLISTGVSQVQVGFNTKAARPLGRVSREELRGYLKAGEFPPGSMGPKIEAALQFLDNGGERVIITSPELIGDAIAGKAGTEVV